MIDAVRSRKCRDVADAHGFPIRPGEARFAGPDLLLVDGEPVPVRAYVIASSAEPSLPDLPDLPDLNTRGSPTTTAGLR